MGAWTDAVEAKAWIIHEQLAVARILAERNDTISDEIARPYLNLLRSLYREEFGFAQLVDSSDLTAHFAGPAVSSPTPTISIVTSTVSDLRNQIRRIAKSIVGLSTDGPRLRWPSELDPHLSGITHGSLVVGVSVPRPDDEAKSPQHEIPGISDQIYESVRAAVRSLSMIPLYVGQDRVDETIREAFPDPAVRDTVMVAASKLAPTGRKGIEKVTLFGPESEATEPPVLTPSSRRVLNEALSRPIRVTEFGHFEGIVRKIDLDAQRFEIRSVQNIGSIRCIYSSDLKEKIGNILDTRVRVSGHYETLKNKKPRLISATQIKIITVPR